MPQTTPAGRCDSAAAFSFPAVRDKKVTAAFDGGRLTSDGGVLVLAQAERTMGICGRLAGCIADPRDPSRVLHRLDDILRARVFAIACGYEDADDLDTLRDDPGFRLALGKLETSKNCWLTAAWCDSLAFAMSGGGNDRAARFL